MPAPSVHLKIKIPVTVRRGISKRSHEKIGDCEQSSAGYLPYNCSDLLLFISSQCCWSWISQRKNGDERIL